MKYILVCGYVECGMLVCGMLNVICWYVECGMWYVICWYVGMWYVDMWYVVCQMWVCWQQLLEVGSFDYIQQVPQLDSNGKYQKISNFQGIQS